jgi:hypothetical protein
MDGLVVDFHADDDADVEDDGPSVVSDVNNDDIEGSRDDGDVGSYADDDTVVDEEGWPDWGQLLQREHRFRRVATPDESYTWCENEERRQAEDPIEQEFRSLLAFHDNAGRRVEPQRPVEELSA